MTGFFKLKTWGATFIGALATFGIATAMEIKTAPSGDIYVNPANARRGYFDLMAQTIIFHNDETGAVTLTALQLDLLGGPGEILSKTVPIESAIATTQEFAGMASQGLGVFLNSQLLNEDGPSAAVSPNAVLASSATLSPGEFALSTAHYFAPSFLPKELLVTLSFLDANGAPQTTHHRIKVKQYEHVIDYIAPLRGNWFISGFPNLKSHHRFLPSNEFALDFFKTGPDGALDQGVKRDPTDDYGFNEPVMAVADGEVVFVIDGQVQDPDALSRRDGESIQDARQRVRRYQFQRYATNFRAAAAGNMIVLRHEQNGVVEFSAYGHLKEESILVKVGDRMKQGDTIAGVGNTGDSTLTHLHFQMNDTANSFFTRSIPTKFNNGEPRYIGAEPGLFMKFEE